VPLSLPVTSLTAGALGLLVFALSISVILRWSAKVSLGDGDDAVLRRRVRAHANCVEYAPLGALLVLVCELQAVAPLALRAGAGCLVVGRILHAIGLTRSGREGIPRFLGMVLTFTALVGLSVLALLQGVEAL